MKTIKNNLAALIILGATLLLAMGSFFVTQVRAGYIQNTQPVRSERLVLYNFFASSTPNATPTSFATTTSATSTNINQWTDANGRIDNGYFDVSGAQSVTMYFYRDAGAGTNDGSSVFSIEVSPDFGTTWVTYNKLISNLTNSNSQTLTRAEEFTISAATSTVSASLSPEDTVTAIRCIVVETTDGSHTCRAVAKY